MNHYHNVLRRIRLVPQLQAHIKAKDEEIARLRAGIYELNELSYKRTTELERLKDEVHLLKLDYDRAKRTTEEQGDLIEVLRRIERALVELLKRVPHHGPQGSYSKAEGQCWPDCVACEFEKELPTENQP